jgi:PTS system fructose-specific IIC component
MKKLGAELKRHALTAISYMLPLVVASGLLIAIGNLMGGENVTELSKMTIPSAMTTLGVLGMGLLPSSSQDISLTQSLTDLVLHLVS